MATPSLPTAPLSVGSSVQVEPLVDRLRLGDGHVQDAAQGVNALARSWRAVWKALDQAAHDTLVDFFAARAGHERFLWQSPLDSAQRKWVCVSWSTEIVSSGVYNVQATLERRYA